jgi:hypothetical protein
MRVKIGLGHDKTDFRVTDAGLQEMLDRTASSTKRFWVIDADGQTVKIRRSAYGYRFQFPPFKRDTFHHRLQTPRNGPVRHHIVEREASWEGQTLVLMLGPHHEWPWIHDMAQHRASWDLCRIRAIAELNARTASAHEHGMPWQNTDIIPQHIIGLITPAEMLLVEKGEKI